VVITVIIIIVIIIIIIIIIDVFLMFPPNLRFNGLHTTKPFLPPVELIDGFMYGIWGILNLSVF